MEKWENGIKGIKGIKGVEGIMDYWKNVIVE